MWWLFFILFFLISVVTSTLLFFSLRRINQYESLIVQFQEIVLFATEKMKQVDTRGHYESDDETGFFFEQLKELQLLLDGIFENEIISKEKKDGNKKSS
jgi:biopolymer transport protein ExbB/TolQ